MRKFKKFMSIEFIYVLIQDVSTFQGWGSIKTDSTSVLLTVYKKRKKFFFEKDPILKNL